MRIRKKHLDQNARARAEKAKAGAGV
jgi:hypothetical protein